MSKNKKDKEEKPELNKNLEGLDIDINEMGEIEDDFDVDKLNEFLDKNVKDKKLEERKETLKNQERPIRVLIGKVGLDGHDRGAKVIASALRDAGMEVIYTGLRQTPEMVAETALQEDVDVVGVSILSGAHMTVFPKLSKLFKDKGVNDVLLIAGGIIPDDDIPKLQKLGVDKVFHPGTNTDKIVNYIRNKMELEKGKTQH